MQTVINADDLAQNFVYFMKFYFNLSFTLKSGLEFSRLFYEKTSGTKY